jgi:hypothetical protein
MSIELKVNGIGIELVGFVQCLFTRTTLGLLGALKGGEDREVHTTEIYIRNHKVDITINSITIPVNAFVGEFVQNTLFGMVQGLKGVTAPLSDLELELKSF